MMKMKWVLAGLLGLVASVALAAGLYTNGLPPAGGTQYPSTVPLTGLETAPFDTNLTQGQNPASEAISVNQLTAATISAAVNTTAFTATTAQVVGNGLVVLNLTGTLGAGAAITMPTAAQIFAVPKPVGSVWTLRLINNSAGAFAWTLTAGTGDTITGSATIAQSTYADYMVTVTSPTTVTFVRIGSGTN